MMCRDEEKVDFENRHNIDDKWGANFILQEKTGSKPHLIAFVVDSNELTEGTLNISELFAVTKLCAVTHYDTKYKQHSIIPVSS